MSTTKTDEPNLPRAAVATAKHAQHLEEKARNERRISLYDTEFWTCVVFETREQSEEFLAKLGFQPGLKYISGLDLLESIGERLEANRMEWPTRLSRTMKGTIIDELADPLPEGRT